MYRLITASILTTVAVLFSANISAMCDNSEEGLRRCTERLLDDQKWSLETDGVFSEAAKSWLIACRRDKTESSCNEAKQNVRDELDFVSINNKEETASMRATVKEFFGNEFTVAANKKGGLKIVNEKPDKPANTENNYIPLENNQPEKNDGSMLGLAAIIFILWVAIVCFKKLKGYAKVIAVAVILPALISVFGKQEIKDQGVNKQIDEVNKTNPSEESKPDALCKLDLHCWGDRNLITASSYCKIDIEKLSVYSSRWTDRFLEQKFSRYKWLNKEKGTLSYFGDKIEFQNSFGAYQNHIYECDFDPTTKTVLAVSAFSGRL